VTVLQIKLLGPFEVAVGDEPAQGFDSDKVRALLAYLAAEAGRSHRRETLAGLFWPEQSERSARANLRRALANLRQVIGDEKADPPFLAISRQTIRFNLASDQRLDVTDFSHLTAGQGATVEELEEALALYRGPFMAGFTLADCAEFETWQLVNREALQRTAVGAMRRLAGAYAQLGLIDQALPHARRRLTLEPWDEDGHRQVMRLLAHSGRRSEALAQYEICRQSLAEALGVEPEAETEQLAERIRSGRLEHEYLQVAEKAVRGYELRERLGIGSFGVVYRAYQPAVKRDVAIKIIRPELASQPDFIRRFDVEAQLAARLEHPNIVPLYDYWRDPEGAYLVMRWLKGGNLADVLRQGPWSIPATARLLDQIGAALDLAHQRGVIHRDIRPANILLDEDGNAYLSDFGVATLAEAVHLAGLTSPITEPGEVSGSPEYISPEQVRHEPLTPAADVYCLGLCLYVLLTGEHPFPGTPEDRLAARHLSDPLPAVTALRPELPQAVDRVIQTATAKDPGRRYGDALTLAMAFREAAMAGKPRAFVRMAARPATAPGNPYKGLRPFQESDAGDFFGREALVKRLLDRLANREPDPGGAGDGRLLAIVGPSGSGKSSVVKAGLIPALRNGAIESPGLPGSDEWYIVEMTPGYHPYQALEMALLQVASQPVTGLRDQMQADEQGIDRAIRRVLPEADSQLVLVIDQFEELFTLTEGEDEREAFLDGLCAAADDGQARLRMIITLRADYYDRPLQHPLLGELIRTNTEIVLPLSRDELERAIAGPAARAGLTLAPGLLQRLQDDIRQEPGALPLLQYALTELFERRQDNMLTQAAYEAIGGVAGAIAQRAEALYAQLSPKGQEASRQLLLRLVALGQDDDSPLADADTRRRVLRSELEELAERASQANAKQEQQTAASSMTAIIDAYGAARLLTFDHDPQTRAPTVEIAHEALIQEWPRLKAWVTESRADLRQQKRLAAAVADWVSAGRDPGFLLQGVRLKQFTVWSESTDLALGPLEVEFVEASLQEDQRRQTDEAERLAKEHSLERRARNLRIALAVAAVVALLAVVFGIIVTTSDLISGVDQAVSSLLQSEPQPAGNEATREASTAAYMVYAIPQGRGVVYDPTGGQIATSGQDAIAVVRDAADGRPLFELRGHRDRINNIAYSLDGQRLATTSLDGTTKVWDAGSGEMLLSIAGPEAELVSPALSPDGALLAATSYNPQWARLTTHVWDTETGEEVATLGFGDQVGGLAFSPDGSMLAMPGTVGKVTVWDPTSGRQLFMLREDNTTVIDVAFSPDGRRLATSHIDGTARVWDLSSRELLITMRGHEGWVVGVDFSPDGRFVATAGQDSTVRLYEADSGRERSVFYGHTEEVLNVSFSPDGRRLASSSEDDTTIVWDISD
jgi:DNA-binding SARP family transcriptional activator/DNA-binding beta-propeller fold protein YncE/energy-coupling factor transporter ATP-binding protein EcfA2